MSVKIAIKKNQKSTTNFKFESQIEKKKNINKMIKIKRMKKKNNTL